MLIRKSVENNVDARSAFKDGSYQNSINQLHIIIR